jgi:hypothetical protein
MEVLMPHSSITESSFADTTFILDVFGLPSGADGDIEKKRALRALVRWHEILSGQLGLCDGNTECFWSESVREELHAALAVANFSADDREDFLTFLQTRLTDISEMAQAGSSSWQTILAGLPAPAGHELRVLVAAKNGRARFLLTRRDWFEVNRAQIQRIGVEVLAY